MREGRVLTACHHVPLAKDDAFWGPRRSRGVKEQGRVLLVHFRENIIGEILFREQSFRVVINQDELDRPANRFHSRHKPLFFSFHHENHLRIGVADHVLKLGRLSLKVEGGHHEPRIHGAQKQLAGLISVGHHERDLIPFPKPPLDEPSPKGDGILSQLGVGQFQAGLRCDHVHLLRLLLSPFVNVVTNRAHKCLLLQWVPQDTRRAGADTENTDATV